ncbi:MAG: GTPase Era [Candidatus Tantalella remota]|nr:GTPase Era [Candidatus Tantalella remota]
MTRSGFVSISGQPNVGKSTILNGLLKEKVAIVSNRPETTRDNLRGILTEKDCQVVFIDTPGIHKPHDLLGKVMLTRAQSSIMESDIILFVTEKRVAFNRDDDNIVKRLPRPEEGKKVILVINKVDRVKDKKILLPLIEKALEIYPFDEIVPISALKPAHLVKLMDVVRTLLPEGPFMYPEDQLTDKNERFLVQEIIREKILRETYEEIPHAIAVVVEAWEEDDEADRINIHANVFVERLSQKAIIIGKEGAMMKKIGKHARADIERMLDRHVYLDLWVKVFDKWKKDPNALREMGYAD